MPHLTMRRRLVLAACAMALCTAGLAAPALASGGSSTGGGGTSTGGGGGGGGTATDPTTPTGTVPGGTPCVQVNGLAGSADQALTTDLVALNASYTVSRCGGSNTSFTVSLTADDAAGNRVLATTDTWVPNRSLPFGASHSTDSAAFGATYRLTLTVTVPETGAVAATSSRSVVAPAARIPTCASVTNLGGTAGYYPGITTQGALWLSYTVKNCGGMDGFDIDFAVINADNGVLVRDYPRYATLAGNTTTGVGLIDVEPVPTSTNYVVRVQLRHHSDGSLLDEQSIALLTPDAK
ncbi:MAG: hypothetical protein JWP11_2196 [Frankiales bacterium]|nr:hypothetical protein [Frankiales bacterium]